MSTVEIIQSTDNKETFLLYVNKECIFTFSNVKSVDCIKSNFLNQQTITINFNLNKLGEV